MDGRKKKSLGLPRLLLFFLLILSLLFLGRKGYEWYGLHAQIEEAKATRQELLEEKQQLEEKKEQLNDPDVIEKKARDELGLVKPGEVPYVK